MIATNFLRKALLQVGLATGLTLAAISAQADVVITPVNTIAGTPAMGPSNCEPGCVYQTFGLPNDGSLTLLYKADVGTAQNPATVESGSFAGSYVTTFLLSALDPSGALISYVAGNSIDCPTCYLAIKDGNQTPAYYFYSLADWNGTESLALSGFWPRQGAISHVSIWGKSTPSDVPEPATLALLGLGLFGAALIRRRSI